ncbi:unnamed protein product [Heterobilharzia americana]|nr:unnamed protein product [Heterobilharzia americana]
MVGLIVVGVIAASFTRLLPQLMKAAGACWSVALTISVFITMKYLRLDCFDRPFTLALFMSYIVWFEEMLLCLSVTLCFVDINTTRNNPSNKDYQDILINLY